MYFFNIKLQGELFCYVNLFPDKPITQDENNLIEE